MWVFKNDAFVSAVADRDDPRFLWVRARVKGDIERFFRGVAEPEVHRTPNADYLYRCCVLKQAFMDACVNAAANVDYTNFKNSIPEGKVGDMRHTYYMRVWNAMLAFQHDFKRRFKK